MAVVRAFLVGSLLLFGAADWPRSRFLSVAAPAVIFGLGYTIYSERLNTARHAWAYSESMPILPGLGTGLAPLAQLVVVPLLAFAAIRSTSWSKTWPIQANQGLDLPNVGITNSRIPPDHLARPSRKAS